MDHDRIVLSASVASDVGWISIWALTTMSTKSFPSLGLSTSSAPCYPRCLLIFAPRVARKVGFLFRARCGLILADLLLLCKAQTVRYLNIEIMCGVELRQLVILFLVAFKEKPFGWSLIRTRLKICNQLLVGDRFLHCLFSIALASWILWFTTFLHSSRAKVASQPFQVFICRFWNASC